MAGHGPRALWRRPWARATLLLTPPLAWFVLIYLAALVVLEGVAEAHGVSRRDASFVESIRGAAIGPFLYLGAKHMVTGYDHLLFLVGVLPALLVVVVRLRLREPDSWLRARALAGPDELHRQMGDLREIVRDPRWRRHALVGLALTWLTIRMLRFAERQGWIRKNWVEIPIVALAAACFAAAQAAGGSGFITCFVGGLLLSGLGERHKEELLRGAEHMGEALALLTWVVFGGIVVARMIDRIT